MPTKFVDGWFWPDQERHLIDWMMDPKNRMVLNGRSAYQGRKQVLLLQHCPADRRGTFIDVGGHVGTWAWNFVHEFKRVEAFEPVPLHRECFEKNTLAMADKIMLHPFALGDRPGRVAIRVDPLSTGGSFVQGKGEVEMRTLDSFNFENVDCLKIDCEGFEQFVLHGAEAMLTKWKPVICVEQKRDFPVKFGLKPMGAVKYLIGLGYKVVAEISGDYVLTHP
jgi:FkbM family methyltransferase